METYRSKIAEATGFIVGKSKVQPRIGLILGSGLGGLADEVQDAVTFSYQDIPHFPVSTVEGHDGKLVIGTLQGQEVLIMQGRFHLYEGYELSSVTFPIRVMKKLGVDTIIVTNAAGGVNETFEPGDLMVIRDHINFTCQNPLIGPNDSEFGERFPDMSTAYDHSLQELAHKVAREQGHELREGVYMGLLGPTYETPAEIRMIRKLGGDAVGMSTVPEVIVARHAGIRVLGISCISNMAAGILPQPLSHREVYETANRVKAVFSSLIKGILGALLARGK